MDPPTPVDPPPPAYAEQHEFDRKIADALQHSLHIAPPPQSEDTWEEWDDAKFEAAARGGGEVPQRSTEKERLAQEDARASAEPSSSSTSAPRQQHGRTASFGRRLPSSPPAPPAAKERPSWFAEAQLGAPAPSPAQVHHVPEEEDEPEDEEQLPAFAAVGPSLEGPPFEEVMRVHPRAQGDSPPQSPLDSVDGFDSPPPNQPPPFVAPLRPAPRAYPRDAHSPPPRVYPGGAHSPPARAYSRDTRSPPPQMSRPTRTSSIAPLSPRPPPMPFDNAMAYTKRRPAIPDPEIKPSGPVNASAFYNSSVSSLLGGGSRAPTTPKKTSTLNVSRSFSTASGASSYTPRTSDPYAPRVAEPFAPQASDPYAPALPSTFSPGGNAYSTYPSQQQQQQQQPYPPQPFSQQEYLPQQQHQQQHPHQDYPPQQHPHQEYFPQQQQQHPHQDYPPQQHPHPEYAPQHHPHQDYPPPLPQHPQSYPPQPHYAQQQQQQSFPPPLPSQPSPYPPPQQPYPPQHQAYYGAPAPVTWTRHGGSGPGHS